MKYHFIGIKGSGMSALAGIMHDLGNEVQGSDKTYYLFPQESLEERGIKMLPFDKNNITKDLTVVIGNAFSDNHQEVIRAKELGVKTYHYFELLGELVKQYQTVAVCGCHGKTTTTSLLSHVFNDIVGTNYLIGDGSGYANKNNKYFMVEACEYKRHFLYYFPEYTILTNIELDHVDYYKTLEDYKKAYEEFLSQTNNTIIACGDDLDVLSLKVKKPILYYGFNENNDLQARNVSLNIDGSEFDVYLKGEFLEHFYLPLYGEHMILNTLAVIMMAYLAKLDLKKVKESIKNFQGAKRRFKEKVIKDIVTIDDYAHHPTELAVTIKSARQKYPDKEIVALYLPNTYSRTKELYKDIAKALNLADKAYVMDIFCEREKKEDWPGVSSKMIIKLLNNGDQISKEEVKKLLVHKNSVMLFMSCTEIYHLQTLYEEMLKKEKE
ncbi:MAG: UDP-N-acetylmuramate--L-alanine ligase [Bacilli bacterium]